jgi:hypothetical protein
MPTLLHSRILRPVLLTLLVAFGFLTAPRVLAEEEVPNEYELKAVMLFNLARFVQWPAAAFAETNSPLIIGILGRDPFGDALQRAVQGETVNGRRLVIEHYDNPRLLQTCHILFISSNEKPRLTQILAKIKGQPILTVSEMEGFSKLPGGMVRFYINDQKKIRLRLNLESAHA